MTERNHDGASRPVNGRVGGRPDEVHLRNLWKFAARNRLLVAGLTLAVVLSTVVYLLVTPPTYGATTLIRIDEEKSSFALLDALQSLQSGGQIGTEMVVLRSRTLAEDVAEELGLQLELKEPRFGTRTELFSMVRLPRDSVTVEYELRRTADDRFELVAGEAERRLGTFGVGEPIRLRAGVVSLKPEALTEESIRFEVLAFDDAVKAFRKVLVVTRLNREADVVEVSYEHTDPVLVKSVVNTIAQRFIDRRGEVQSSEARSTVVFLQSQLDSLRLQLALAEDRLQTFREQEGVILPQAEAEAQIGQLADLQAQRDVVAAERAALATTLRRIESQDAPMAGEPSPYRRLIGFPTLLRNPAASQLLASLTEVENQRSELLERRTLEDPPVAAMTERIRELEEDIRTIGLSYLEGLTNQTESYDRELAQFTGLLSEIPRKDVQFARLQREAMVLEEIFTLLQTRLKEAEIVANVEDTSVRVIDPAIVPREPERPKKMFSLVLALVVGLMLGVGTAFAREHLDNAVHSREDLELAAAGAPVLGLIPRIQEVGNGRRKRWLAPAAGNGSTRAVRARLVTGRDPRNPVSEAYRSLRTNITFSQPDRPPRSLVFTSPMPGDGKSTSSSNLAITLAQQELNCLLIDADMRRGVLNEVLGTPREPGLSHLLLERAELAATIHKIDVGQGHELSFMPTGVLPPNPAELLGSDRMRALLQRLQDEYDIIILDAPPLNVVTDAAILGTKTDGVVVVARAGSTDQDAVAYAIEQLHRVRAPVLGTILNDIDVRKDQFYGRYAVPYGSYHKGQES